MKHTPGKWNLWTFVSGDWQVFSDDGGVIAARSSSYGRDGDEMHANGRLVAAAPDLLEACKAALAWRALDGDGISDPTRLALIAAVKKAEGR